MEPHSHPAVWIEAIGWFSLAVAFAAAFAILIDVFLLGYLLGAESLLWC